MNFLGEAAVAGMSCYSISRNLGTGKVGVIRVGPLIKDTKCWLDSLALWFSLNEMLFYSLFAKQTN